MPYEIEYSPDAEEHLRLLTARHQPTVKTKNRKPMRPNPLAPWELRIGDLRVYYDVEEDPKPMV